MNGKESKVFTPELLDDAATTAALKTAYEASDLIGEVLVANVPVMSPATDRYRNLLRNAQSRYSQAIEDLSVSSELLGISEAIHTSRCGCLVHGEKDGCDWHVAGNSSERSRLLLQAGELKLNGFSREDVDSNAPEIEGFLTYLDGPPAKSARDSAN